MDAEKGSSGASLLEVVVAMAILAITVAGVAGVYSTVTKASKYATDSGIVVDVIQSRLSELENEIQSSGTLSEKSGEFSGSLTGWSWTAESEDVEPELSQKLIRLTVVVKRPSKGQSTYETLIYRGQ